MERCRGRRHHPLRRLRPQGRQQILTLHGSDLSLAREYIEAYDRRITLLADLAATGARASGAHFRIELPHDGPPESFFMIIAFRPLCLFRLPRAHLLARPFARLSATDLAAALLSQLTGCAARLWPPSSWPLPVDLPFLNRQPLTGTVAGPTATPVSAHLNSPGAPSRIMTGPAVPAAPHADPDKAGLSP